MTHLSPALGIRTADVRLRGAITSWASFIPVGLSLFVDLWTTLAFEFAAPISLSFNKTLPFLGAEANVAVHPCLAL